MARFAVACWLAVAALLAGRGSAHGQAATENAPASEAAPGPKDNPSGMIALVGREATIYWDDAKGLFFAPFHWNGTQVATAAGGGAAVGAFMIFDDRLAQDAQNHASAATNQMSRIATPFGSWAAWATSGVLIVSGVAFHDTRVTSMGREGVEACLIAGLMTDVLKPVFGRERPDVSGNRAVYKPFSGNDSFPSGHATVAFALASVVSARSSGWVIPTASYTLASLVAYSRVNDAKHFPSDVVAGGLIGATVGRFIVHRHERALSGAAPPRVEISLYPIHNGLGAAARF